LAGGSIRDVAQAAQAINGMLAPAIMISASALIILALQGKYSQLIDRLRTLNDERRRLKQLPQPSEQRLANVVAQIEMILIRARLVRNSIVSLYLAIMLFVLSSIMIGIRLTLGIRIPVSPSLIIFMIGMVFVLAGVLYAFRDIARAYKVAQLEVRGVKELEEGE
jgi:hypothetical protein